MIMHKLNKYESVCKTFQRFFDSEDMIRRWDTKADLTLVKSLCAENAPKVDLAETNDIIDQIYKRI